MKYNDNFKKNLFLGDEKYRAVSRLYIRGALGCVVVSDITNKKTLDESIEWKKLIEKECNSGEDM